MVSGSWTPFHYGDPAEWSKAAAFHYCKLHANPPNAQIGVRKHVHRAVPLAV